jgi:acetyl-CoA synthetase
MEIYWSKFKGTWYHGDVVSKDSDGLWYILGRADDIIKISGHRIGSAELEAAITSHPAVAEAMTIGVPDKLKGQSIVAYIILKKEYQSSNKNSEAESKLRGEIIQSVVNGIGNFARPEQITFVDDLPRTTTGKTVRRPIGEKSKHQQY